MNLLSLSVLVTGGTLIYCALKGYDPRDLVRAAVTGDGMPDEKYTIGDNGIDLPGFDDDLIPDIPGPGVDDLIEDFTSTSARRPYRPSV